MREIGIDPELEKEADRILKEAAKRTKKPDGTPFIRPNGRGYQEYFDHFGIRTKKHDEKLRQTEITGLDLEVAMRPIGIRMSRKIEDEDE